MGSMKGAVALIAVLVPIVYCGAMVYYFFGVGGSMQGVAAIGLGPTVLGLGAIGLLFCVPLLIRILKLDATTPSKPGARPRFAANMPVEEEAFDADAALARYLARKAEAGDEPQAVVAETGHAQSASARPAFGRKVA